MSVTSTLTDQGGVAPITAKKLVKDFVADFLIGASAGVAAVAVGGLQDAVATPLVVGFALGNAAIAAGYRVVLRWATSA